MPLKGRSSTNGTDGWDVLCQQILQDNLVPFLYLRRPCIQLFNNLRFKRKYCIFTSLYIHQCLCFKMNLIMHSIRCKIYALSEFFFDILRKVPCESLYHTLYVQYIELCIFIYSFAASVIQYKRPSVTGNEHWHRQAFTYIH